MSDESTKPPIFEVWKEYEKIAMHFNDLLVKLRTQALGVVATLSTLIAIMSGNDEGGTNWALIAIGFFVLSIIWLAIWILDFLYYSKLLHGAVAALLEVETLSKQGAEGAVINEIQMSTLIEKAVNNELPAKPKPWYKRGRWIFYSLVMIVFLAVSILSIVMLCKQSQAPQASQALQNSTAILRMAL